MQFVKNPKLTTIKPFQVIAHNNQPITKLRNVRYKALYILTVLVYNLCGREFGHRPKTYLLIVLGYFLTKLLTIWHIFTNLFDLKEIKTPKYKRHQRVVYGSTIQCISLTRTEWVKFSRRLLLSGNSNCSFDISIWKFMNNRCLTCS